MGELNLLGCGTWCSNTWLRVFGINKTNFHAQLFEVGEVELHCLFPCVPSALRCKPARIAVIYKLGNNNLSLARPKFKGNLGMFYQTPLVVNRTL